MPIKQFRTQSFYPGLSFEPLTHIYNVETDHNCLGWFGTRTIIIWMYRADVYTPKSRFRWVTQRNSSHGDQWLSFEFVIHLLPFIALRFDMSCVNRPALVEATETRWEKKEHFLTFSHQNAFILHWPSIIKLR